MHDSQPVIRPLDASTPPDFLHFSITTPLPTIRAGHFATCQFLYVDHNQVNWNARTLDENRTRSLQTGLAPSACEPSGLAGRQGGRLVQRPAPRPMMHSFDDEPVADADRIGHDRLLRGGQTVSATRPSSPCCVPRAMLSPHRARLRAGAGATQRGSEAENHFGPLAMYLSEGFVVQSEDDDGVVVLRKVALNPTRRIDAWLQHCSVASVLKSTTVQASRHARRAAVAGSIDGGATRSRSSSLPRKWSPAIAQPAGAVNARSRGVHFGAVLFRERRPLCGRGRLLPELHRLHAGCQIRVPDVIPILFGELRLRHGAAPANCTDAQAFAFAARALPA